MLNLKNLEISYEYYLDTPLHYQRLEPLLKAFDCGNPYLNNYLYKCDLEDSEVLHLARTPSEIVAYYSLMCTAILIQNHFIPAIEIKMMALQKAYHGMVINDYGDHLSDAILNQCIMKCRLFTEEAVGARYIVTYAIPDKVSFYTRNGFMKFASFMEPKKYSVLEGCEPLFFDLA